MTICIAAIGNENGSEFVVFATDHMISHPSIGQFEHAIDKYRKINDEYIAMFSGDTLLFSEILRDIQKENTNFDGITTKLYSRMCSLRDKRVKEEILNLYNVDWSFVKNNLDKKFENPIITQIMQAIPKVSLRSDILLVGFTDNMARIAQINEVRISDQRDINFGAIGSGAIQALNTLLFQRHSKESNLATTLYNVYKAKRSAEAAIGVGKDTDLLILFKNGKLTKLEDTDIKTLAAVYYKETEVSSQSLELKRLNEKYGLVK